MKTSTCRASSAAWIASTCRTSRKWGWIRARKEAGMIRAIPQKIVADGTDWRFLNELKKELKA